MSDQERPAEDSRPLPTSPERSPTRWWTDTSRLPPAATVSEELLRRRRSLVALTGIVLGVAAVMSISLIARTPVVLLPVVLLALVFLVVVAFDIAHVVLPRTRSLLITMAIIAALGRNVLSSVSHHPVLLDGLAVLTCTSVVVVSAALFRHLCDRLSPHRF
ncbi:MAG: hypothetical protein ACYCST_09885 [Acidimicrobiales bacterium]